MDVTLPSGNTVQIRDQFMKGDRREAERALVVVRQPDGSARLEGSPFSAVAEAILRCMIISWSFGPPPSAAGNGPLAERMFNSLNDDDWSALQKVVAPWANRIVLGASGGSYIHAPTGVTVIVTSPEDAVKLGAHPDFTSEDEGPKQIVSPLTATPSSASPELPGPTPTG